MSDNPPGAESENPPAKPVKPPRVRKVKPPTPEGLTPIASLSRDLRVAALTLGDREARFLVDFYYSAQDDRIRNAHQVRSLAKSGEPNDVLAWFLGQSEVFEKSVAAALDAYSQSRPEGIWGRSIVGIGPIIVAGLMANIRVEKGSTVGQTWRFAGLDPTTVWEKKTKRPWNASLKRLCFIAGTSFVKFSNHPDDIYGKVYRKRRSYEVTNNDAGHLSEQARFTLENKNFSKDTEALAWYSGCYPAGTCRAWNDLEIESRQVFPDDSQSRTLWLNKSRATYLLSVRVDAGKGLQMLPPSRILLRSQRFAVKLFLAHWHYVLHEIQFGEPPRTPYVLDANTHLKHPELGVHTEFLGPPNWPMGKTGSDESADVGE